MAICIESEIYLELFCNAVYRCETKKHKKLVTIIDDVLMSLNEFEIAEPCKTVEDLEKSLIYHAFDEFTRYTFFFIEHDVVFFEYRYSITQYHTILNLFDLYRYLEYCLMTGCLFEVYIDNLKIF